MLTSLRKKVESAKNRGLKSLEIVHILTTEEHIVCLILYACRFYVSRDSAFGGGPANLYQPHWWSILYSLNYWERLAHLKLMSLQRRRERYIILMMWKTYHNVVPNSCSIEFVETSRYGTKAVVPSLSKSSSLRNQTLYDSSFAVTVRGSKLWNKVPSEVKAEKTFASFKVSLSKFLALIPDNPPVSGYTCSWSNSLVDYTPSRWSDIWWPFLLRG